MVVTIVVLLILAGITITYVMGDNSIFKKAEKSKLEYNIAKAREKIEINFGQAKILKYTDKKYNQDEYLDELMKKEIPAIKILDDIVIVDGYAFEIDRNEPKIGKYVGEEEALVFPEITTMVVLATDNKTAAIHITAKEEKNGISKIEIIQDGYVLEEYTYDNKKEEIIEDYTAKQNGTYTIKVYTNLTARELVKVDGIIMSIEYIPNGNTEYKKEHQVKVNAKETGDKIKSIKYQWLQTTVEPAESSFITECSNGKTITKNGVTGTYYLWTLLETESGKTRIERSEEFNFDNQGPTVTLTSTPDSETTIRLSATASDEHSEITRYEFYVNGSKINRTENEVLLPVATGNIGTMAENVNCEVIVYDSLGNSTRESSTSRTLLHTWEKWTRKATVVYGKDGKIVSKDYINYKMPSARFYTAYTFDPASGYKPSGSKYSSSDRRPVL